MNKLRETLYAIAITLLAIVCIWSMCKVYSLQEVAGRQSSIIQRDTIIIQRVDTIIKSELQPVYRYTKDTIYIIEDKVIHDTLQQVYKVEQEHVVYADTSFRAVVSGIAPRLDTLEVYPHNTVSTIYQTKYANKRFGIGIQGGYGYNGHSLSPYIGVGVHYTIINL